MSYSESKRVKKNNITSTHLYSYYNDLKRFHAQTVEHIDFNKIKWNNYYYIKEDYHNQEI